MDPGHRVGLVLQTRSFIEILIQDILLNAIRDLEPEPLPAIPKECARCPRVSPTLRCLDCFAAKFMCCECLVEQHEQHPFHRIEMWSPHGLEGHTLQNCGLRVRLGGHTARDECPLPQTENHFLVLDHTGYHQVSMDYCGCGTTSHYKQLLDAKLYVDYSTWYAQAVTFELARLANEWIPPTSRVSAKYMVGVKCEPVKPESKQVKREAKAEDSSWVAGWDAAMDAILGDFLSNPVSPPSEDESPKSRWEDPTWDLGYLERTLPRQRPVILIAAPETNAEAARDAWALAASMLENPMEMPPGRRFLNAAEYQANWDTAPAARPESCVDRLARIDKRMRSLNPIEEID
ncbi:hypothetical protein C8R43DRAFT_1130125 [Mycena crocata]|nr:hypothetical protein C8R43DRAFT_1130125 [Mycena crocata]